MQVTKILKQKKKEEEKEKEMQRKRAITFRKE